MSRLPNTSLVVNQRGVDTLSFGDTIYLMAPAIQGGEKRNEAGEVIYSQGFPVYEAKKMYTLRDVEIEFGLISNASPLSVYAKWIYDYGNYPVWCRRVTSQEINAASAVLYSKDGFAALKLLYATQDTHGNDVKIDVDTSTNVEGYIQVQNFFYDSAALLLQTSTRYNQTDRLVFEGKLLDSNKKFRAAFFGNSNITTYHIFDMLPMQGSIRFGATVGTLQFTYAGDNIPQNQLGTREFSYNTVTKEIIFGGDISIAWTQGYPYSVKIRTGSSLGDIEYSFSMQTNETSIAWNFSADNIQFDAMYLNGYGEQNNVKYIKLARIMSVNREHNEKYSFRIAQGTITGTKKFIVSTSTNKQEVYDNIKTLAELESKIASSTKMSKLIDINIYENGSYLFPIQENTDMQLIGFKLSVYRNGYVEAYDDLATVDEAATFINDMSIFVKAEVLSGNGALILRPIIGMTMVGGSSGLNAITVDYLDALTEAENKGDITIIIAPGVSDVTFHKLLQTHCEQMAAIGKRRITIVGGDLDETIVQKAAIGEQFNSPRVIRLGDGLVLSNPITAQREVYPAATITPVIAGRIVSIPYYTSLTHQYIPNAYGTEHIYDDAQLEFLHGTRLVVFKNESGVQICDGITTSTYNAYEDLHMVRIYDAISNGVTIGMQRAMGNSNMPPTWAVVTKLIRVFLEALQGVRAIDSYSLLNETRPQHLVDRTFVFRIGIIPIFPVKYIEGMVDIIPPTSI